MDEMSIVLESLTPEQYKKFYSNLPMPSMALTHSEEAYINSLSNNENLNKVVKLLIDNNINVSRVNSSCVNSIVDLSNAKVFKYLREHLMSKSVNVEFKNIGGELFEVSLNYGSDRDLMVINQILSNYLSVNAVKKSEIVKDYIVRKYMATPMEYIEYVKEVNKNDIMHLEEKHIQETTLPFNKVSNVKVNDFMKNEVKLEDIYNQDDAYKKIPFNKMSDEQKQVMANKYFREVAKKRLFVFNTKIKDMYGVYFNVKYNNQIQRDLGLYGISGNTPEFKDNMPFEVDVFMYPDIKYATVDGNVAKLNTDLVGQIMITTLHEQEHILQRIGKISDNLKFAIDNFDMITSYNPSYEIDNYSNDPAEIDANLASFNRFMELADIYNIDNVDQVILNKVKYVQSNADEEYNFYDDTKFESKEDVTNYMYQKLLESIDNYTNMEDSIKSR